MQVQSMHLCGIHCKLLQISYNLFYKFANLFLKITRNKLNEIKEQQLLQAFLCKTASLMAVE